MAKGASQEIIFENTRVVDVLGAIAHALTACKFKVLEQKVDGGQGSLKAVWGKKLKAYLVGNLPFGKLLKSGKRLGVEVVAFQRGPKIHTRLLIVPYMELWNRPEVFLISQGILEKLTDDRFSRKKLQEVLSRLRPPAPTAQPTPPVPQG